MENIATHFLRAKDDAGKEVTIIRRGRLIPTAPRGTVLPPPSGEAYGCHYTLPDGQPLVEAEDGSLRHEATGQVFTDLRA